MIKYRIAIIIFLLLILLPISSATVVTLVANSTGNTGAQGRLTGEAPAISNQYVLLVQRGTINVMSAANRNALSVDDTTYLATTQGSTSFDEYEYINFTLAGVRSLNSIDITTISSTSTSVGETTQLGVFNYTNGTRWDATNNTSTTNSFITLTYTIPSSETQSYIMLGSTLNFSVILWTTGGNSSQISGDLFQAVVDYEPDNWEPPTPINLTGSSVGLTTTISWSPDIGNITDYYRSCYICDGSDWVNNSLTSRDLVVLPHGWANITVYAVNSSGTIIQNNTPATLNYQVANQNVTLNNISDKTRMVGEWLNFTVLGVDPDGDTLTYGTNATRGSFDSVTGNFNWSVLSGEDGTYIWYYNVTDGNGSVDTKTVTITILPLGSIVYSASWSKFHNDTRNTGQSQYPSYSNGSLKWNINLTTGVIYSSPTIDSNGIIYVGTYDNLSSGILYAVYPNGSIKCNYPTGKAIEAAPTIASDGTVYITNWNYTLFAINPDCALKWSYYFGAIDHDTGKSSVNIDSNGIVYVGTGKELNAFYPNGILKWQYTTHSWVFDSSPAIDFSGIIYIGDSDGYLYAINPNGTLNWEISDPDLSGISSPAIDANNIVYIAHYNGEIEAYYPNSTLKWQYIGSTGSVSPAISSEDGTVYMGNDVTNELYALTSDGLFKWNYTTNGSITYSSPAIELNGTVYVGNNYYSGGYHGELLAINKSGSLRWKYDTGDSIDRSSPAIGSNGVVYVGSNTGYLYAFESIPITTISGYNFSGTTKDIFSDIVPSANVTLSNTSYSITTTSDGSGSWSLPLLTNGRYNITAQKSRYDIFTDFNVLFETGGDEYNISLNPTYTNVTGWNFAGFPWVYSNCGEGQHGSCSARSDPRIQYNWYASMNKTINNSDGASYLSFYWKLNTSGTHLFGDSELCYYLDGVNTACAVANVGWRNVTTSLILSGNHTIEFKYYDYTLTGYNRTSDGGFVDNITIEPFYKSMIDTFESGNLNNWSHGYWTIPEEDWNVTDYWYLTYGYAPYYPYAGNYSATSSDFDTGAPHSWLDIAYFNNSISVTNTYPKLPIYLVNTWRAFTDGTSGGSCGFYGCDNEKVTVYIDNNNSGSVETSNNIVTHNVDTGWQTFFGEFPSGLHELKYIHSGINGEYGTYIPWGRAGVVDNIYMLIPYGSFTFDDFENYYDAKGFVIDGFTGAGIANVTVTYWNLTSNVSIITDATGHYDLTNQTSTGLYNFSAVGNGYFLGEGYVYLYDGGCNVDIGLYNTRIIGTVYDAKTGLPISGASVTFFQYNYTNTSTGRWFNTTSNATGNYSLSGFELNKTINVSASYPNYYHNDFNITVPLPGTYLLDIYLVPLCPGFVCGLTERLSFVNSSFYWLNPTLGLLPISNATVNLYNATYSNSTLSSITGYYEIPISADGNYSIYANKSKYVVRKTETVNVTNLTAVKFLLCICRGDINLDEYINVNDFVLFGVFYNSNSTSPRYYWLSDLNDDNKINMDDFTIFAINYKTYCGVV